MSYFTSLSLNNARILLAYADCDMEVRKTARTIHGSDTMVNYHLAKIRRVTGLNPKCFYDLIKLVEMMRNIIEKDGGYNVER